MKPHPIQYNPKIHHRKSIRLKTHDYSGGGLYFVTICAHREFITATNGNPFGIGARPTSPSPVQKQPPHAQALIEERMRITEEKCPSMHWEEHVIMPDHFHALIRIKLGGTLSLGNIIGGFKSAVSRHLHIPVGARACPALSSSKEKAGQSHAEGRARQARTEGRAGQAHARTGEEEEEEGKMRIWHRNYYEMIVRSPEAEKNIRQYIRMNPWRCVQNFGNGLRGMGNPALWNANKLGILCSRNAPPLPSIPDAEVYMGGFHSPPEQIILKKLLASHARIIYCPAWGIGGRLNKDILDALNDNRILILEMKNQDGNLAAAKQRNEFVIEKSDNLWLPHITPGGMLDGLIP